mgnify:FL=1
MSLVHVAVDKKELETAQRCAPEVLQLLLPLLTKLGSATAHPNLLEPCAIDSIGFYLDEEPRAEARRAELVNGDQSMRLEYKTRRFDVMLVPAADSLPNVQRRQCVAIQGTNEVARRLDASERGAAEILATFRCGATLSVRQHKRPERMIVLCTSAQKTKKVLDATLSPPDVPKLVALFAAAARGPGAAGGGSSGLASGGAASENGRFVKTDSGSYWMLPSWYAEACAVVAQDVFRLHALISATSQHISRMIFVDRVTAHRIDGGSFDTHRTLIKVVLHRASGGCACGLHRPLTPTQAFKHLVMRLEFCGCLLDARGKCNRHFLAPQKTESAAFPGVCVVGLKLQFQCEHEERAGIRIPLQTDDARMDLGFAQRFLVDLASCGARLMDEGAHGELATDVSHLLQELESQRISHNHLSDAMLQRDVSAVYLLRTGSSVAKKTGRFSGRVRADCNAILKTHKHLFRLV